MRTLEKTLIILSALGLVAKELHIPGGAILFVVGLSALACLYMFASWLLFRDRETKTQKPALAIPAGFVLAIACVGILFKLQLWPGSEENLLFAAVTLVTISGASFYLRNKNKEESPAHARFFRNVLQRTIPFLVIVVILAMISDNAMTRFHYRHDPEFARLLIQARDNPGNEQYQRELEDYMMEKYERVN